MRRLFRLWWPDLQLHRVEHQTFRRHLVAAVPDGAYFGMMTIAAYVLRRALHASDFQVTLFFSLQMSMFMFSSVASSFLNSENHRRFILTVAFLGPLSLVTIIACPKAFYLIGLIAWVSLIQAVYLPAQNMIFRSNYRRETRGVCYARAKMIALPVTSLTAMIAGLVLEWNDQAFPFLFAAAGLVGFVAYFLYYSMPRPQIASRERGGRRRFPYADFFEILRSDKFFRRYETYFFMYGVAFMMSTAMVPIFVNDVLNASWREAARVFGVIHPAIMIVFLPVYGRLLDKTSVVPVASLAYLALAFWPFTLALTNTMPFAYVAYVFFGLGMAGVDVAWTLGSNTFAPQGRIQSYMAIHVTLVGIRALMAPFLGLLVKQTLGFTATFGLAGFILVTASLLMARLGRHCTREDAPCSSAPQIAGPTDTDILA
jgi:MFS family permease